MTCDERTFRTLFQLPFPANSKAKKELIVYVKKVFYGNFVKPKKEDEVGEKCLVMDQ